MTKTQLVCLAGVVGTVIYLLFFVTWFPSKPIEVASYVRPPLGATRHRPGGVYLGKPVSPIAFTLSKKCKLTEVQVVNAEDYATNKYAHPLWHLVAGSTVPPTRAFYYGGYIKGMRPSVPNAVADPLEPNVAYRLILFMNKAKVEYDFKGPPLPKKRRR